MSTRSMKWNGKELNTDELHRLEEIGSGQTHNEKFMVEVIERIYRELAQTRLDLENLKTLVEDELP